MVLGIERIVCCRSGAAGLSVREAERRAYMLTAEVTQKLESLSQDDYNMVVMLINRLADRPSSRMKNMREKMLEKNPMYMEEIDKEIQQYRKEARG